MKIEAFTQKKRLNNQITKEEIQKCSMKLKNNRASDYDKVYAVYIKYGPEILHNEITTVLNNIFEKKEARPTNTNVTSWHYQNQKSPKDQPKTFAQSISYLSLEKYYH